MSDIINEEKFLKLLKLVSPGTPIRQGLEIILQANTGGLIVVGDTQEVINAIDGGFKVDCPLTPTALAELSKMDGAIIISKDIKKISYANVQLVPDYLIPTTERGTRHRAAERMAKQTDCPVIAISQSRRVITLYQGNIKYVLKGIPELISRASQALQTMERYRMAFSKVLDELELLEFRGEVKLYNVVRTVQRGQMIKKIKEEIERYIIELGEEARLIKMQLKEIVGDAVEENEWIVQDYAQEDPEKVLLELEQMSMDKLLETKNIMRILGYEAKPENLDLSVFPRGYRILSKIPRLPTPVVKNVVNFFGDLPNIMKATVSELTKINEVGEKRANFIKQELERLKNKALLGR
ncbi:DNA integrity scanning protein DisA [Candidatus Aerophobetes bacterium]|uniref:DNA integrity scanning protein DisA n=1 Tax=Aerophobetes bacterium TaxID=2030807 RepID=A0A497E829_UNCAE|nr:MAG: DNA integrity scanning protein DisA [Candidatus Aerophobetes bacterium]